MREFTCIICPNGCEIRAEIEEKEGGAVEILSIEGAACKKGNAYVEQELKDPQRNIATSVLVKGGILPLALSLIHILLIFIDALIFALALTILTVGGTKLAVSARKEFSALLGISRSMVYSMAPVSGVFIMVAQIINIWEDVTGIVIKEEDK